MRLGRAAGATAIGYLVGTFPTADLVAKRVSGGRIGLGATGSGNPGGANALKVLGAGPWPSGGGSDQQFGDCPYKFLTARPPVMTRTPA